MALPRHLDSRSDQCHLQGLPSVLFFCAGDSSIGLPILNFRKPRPGYTYTRSIMKLILKLELHGTTEKRPVELPRRHNLGPKKSAKTVSLSVMVSALRRRWKAHLCRDNQNTTGKYTKIKCVPPHVVHGVLHLNEHFNITTTRCGFNIWAHIKRCA